MDVFFEPQRSKPFSIEVGYFDTVLEIKEKIEKYQRIPVSKQTLIFNGRILQDDSNVEQCEILHNSRIQLLVSYDQSTDNNGNNDHNVNNNRHDIVKIERSTPLDIASVPSTSRLSVPIETDSMEPSVPVNRMVIQSNGQDFAVSTNPRKLRLLVLPKCGTRKIPVELNASDNVRELRRELARLNQRLQFNLPQDGYFFIYKQNVMDDDRSFRWHHVAQGDTIEIFNGSVSGGS